MQTGPQTIHLHRTRRLTNSIMMHGRNNGKKLMAVGIDEWQWGLVACALVFISAYVSAYNSLQLFAS